MPRIRRIRRLRSPGKVVRIRITLFPTANLFLPGHRIRLDISSSNFPKFDLNPHTGEPEGTAQADRSEHRFLRPGPLQPAGVATAPCLMR